MSKISFLPIDYEAPKTAGNFLNKFEQGTTRIRILSKIVPGWIDWTVDKKPVRYPYVTGQPAPAVIDKSNPKAKVKHFWLVIVWNYTAEKLQIAEITQAQIRKPIEDLSRDEDWGAPYFYDIKITREGEGLDTEYSVTPAKPTPLSPHIKEAFDKQPIWLEALLEAGDPFAQHDKRTAGIFDSIGDGKGPLLGPSVDQTDKLAVALKSCSPEFQKTIEKFCKNNNINSDLKGINDELFGRLEKGIMNDLSTKKAVGQ